MAYSCGGRFCGVGGVLVLHLVFYLVPVRLPLSGFCPLPLLLLTLRGCGNPFRLQFAGLLLRQGLVVGLEGYLLRHLVFSQGLQLAQLSPLQVTLGVFRSPGVCPSASLVMLVGLQPFPSFSVLLLPRLLAGFCTLCQGAPVAVVSAWVEGAVTLLPFPYLRVGVLLAYGVSGVCGLRRRSWLPFVVRHPFPVSVCPSPFFWGWGGLVTGLWPLLRLLGFGLF